MNEDEKALLTILGLFLLSILLFPIWLFLTPWALIEWEKFRDEED